MSGLYSVSALECQKPQPTKKHCILLGARIKSAEKVTVCFSDDHLENIYETVLYWGILPESSIVQSSLGTLFGSMGVPPKWQLPGRVSVLQSETGKWFVHS